jgi:hypothetical protein
MIDGAQAMWLKISVPHQTVGLFRFYISNLPAKMQLFRAGNEGVWVYNEEYTMNTNPVGSYVYFKIEMYPATYYARITRHYSSAITTAGTIMYTDLRAEAEEITIDTPVHVEIPENNVATQWYKFTLAEPTWLHIDSDAFGDLRKSAVHIGLRNFDVDVANLAGLSLAPEYEVLSRTYGILPAGTYYVVPSKPQAYWPDNKVDCNFIVQHAAPLLTSAEELVLGQEKILNVTPGGKFYKISIPETTIYDVNVTRGYYPRVYSVCSSEYINFYSGQDSIEIAAGEYYVLVLWNGIEEEVGKLTIG